MLLLRVFEPRCSIVKPDLTIFIKVPDVANQLLTMNENAGQKWTDIRLSKIACPSLAAGLKYCRAAFLAVGQGGENATDLNIEKVLRQPIMTGGKEIWEARKRHSELELSELHSAAAKITGCVPALQRELKVNVVTGNKENQEDMRVVSTLWGDDAPAEAWVLVEMVRRSTDLHDLEDRMGKARVQFQRRAPVPINILQEQISMQDKIEHMSRNAYVEKKLPMVLRAFGDVVAMCDIIKKALEQTIAKAEELECQRSAEGVKAAKWNRDKDIVVANINKVVDGAHADLARKRSVKSLEEKIAACAQEEIAACKRRDKFKSKCEELLVPAQDICGMLDEVSCAASRTRLAIQTLVTLKDALLAKLVILESLPAL